MSDEGPGKFSLLVASLFLHVTFHHVQKASQNWLSFPAFQFPCLWLNQQSSPGVENLWGLHDVSRALWHLWVQDSIINSQYYYIEWSCNGGCFAKLCALYADQEEVDMEQQTGSKEEKEYIKAVCCHCAYLTYMQSTSWETLGWKKHKLESRFLGEILITSDMQMTLLLWQKVKMI